MKVPSLNTERIAQIFSTKGDAFFSCGSFNLKAFRNSKTKTINASLITGKKKVSKSAVIRHRVDRRLKQAISSTFLQSKLKGYDILFFTTPAVYDRPWNLLLKDLEAAVARVKKPLQKQKP